MKGWLYRVLQCSLLLFLFIISSNTTPWGLRKAIMAADLAEPSGPLHPVGHGTSVGLHRHTDFLYLRMHMYPEHLPHTPWTSNSTSSVGGLPSNNKKVIGYEMQYRNYR
jgi:hypothetical protein